MKTIVILFLLTFGALSFPIGNMTLEKKVETSDLILEGTVIKSHSFFDKKMFFIFTYNEILVSKLFKGTLISDTVGIITPGGALDGHAIDIADCALQGPMTKGKVAIFFCKPTDYNLLGIEPCNNCYSVVEFQYGIYTLSKRDSNIHASCEGENFNDIDKDLYEGIEKYVGHNYNQLRLNAIEQQLNDKKAEHVQRIKEAKENAENNITFQIQHAHYFADSLTSPPVAYFSFDAYVNANWDRKLLISSDIFIEYDTMVFGMKPVAERRIIATSSNLNPKAYRFSVSDYSAGLIRISIASDTSQGKLALLDTLSFATGNKFRLFHLTARLPVEVKRSRMYLALSKMQGQSKYYDLEKRDVLSFKNVFSLSHSFFITGKK